jgi:Arc/MetJ-type ribon-helix-helix transcriptional regulator
MRKKNVLLRVRLPELLVQELDNLVAKGYFQSRSEAVAEAIRRLLLAYSVSSRIPGSMFKLTIEGSSRQDLGPGDTFEIDVEEARKHILEFFGSDSVDDIIRKTRMRI